MAAPSPKYLSSDQALHLAGGNSRFQLVYAGLNFLTLVIFNDILIYPLAFLNSKDALALRCDGEPCTIDAACSGQHFQVDWAHSKHNYISDFDLECVSGVLLSLMGTLYFIGFGLGSVFWLSLADRIGKRKVIFIGLACHFVLLLLLVLGSGQWVPYLFTLLLGLQFASTSQTAYIMLLQVVGIEQRAIYSTVYNMVTGSLNIWLPFYFRDVPTYEYLLYTNFVLTILAFFFYLLILPESPRYLISAQRFQEARRVFQKIATCNRRQLPSNLHFQGEQTLLGDESDSQIEVSVSVSAQTYGIRALCKRSNGLLLPTLLSPAMWFTVVLVYYGINFGIGQLRGDIYLNGVISGVAELAGYLASGLCSRCYGRKTIGIVSFAIAGVACLLYPFLADSQSAAYILVMLGKLGVGSAFQLVMLWTTELFPTPVRGTAFGLSNVFGRIGGILAPLASSVLPTWFMLIFGVFSLLCCVVTFFLKDTSSTELEDNVVGEGA